MSYYHLPTSTARNPGRLESKLDDGYKIGPPDTGWTPDLAALCGFVPIADTPQPADTATHTHDRAVTLIDGVPTVTWTQRTKTAAELAAITQATNTSTLEAKARAALTANGTYLALAAPTNAQTVAQVKALTRQVTALTRLAIRGDLLDATTGT